MNGAADHYPGPERRHRVLTDADAEALAARVADQMVERLADPAVADRVMAAWSRQLDQQIGRGVRRLLLWVGLALLGLASVKFEVWSKLIR